MKSRGAERGGSHRAWLPGSSPSRGWGTLRPHTEAENWRKEQTEAPDTSRVRLQGNVQGEPFSLELSLRHLMAHTESCLSCPVCHVLVSFITTKADIRSHILQIKIERERENSDTQISHIHTAHGGQNQNLDPVSPDSKVCVVFNILLSPALLRLISWGTIQLNCLNRCIILSLEREVLCHSLHC